MSAYMPLILPLALVLLLCAVIATPAAVRLVRDRRRARRRVVEQPNSHFTPELVRARETRERWRDIALDRVHEINRGEVVRLLARVEAMGPDALRPAERVFLERMTEIAGEA
jgi:DNA-binding helix-hairpin-helix protein with protein kinase domain